MSSPSQRSRRRKSGRRKSSKRGSIAARLQNLLPSATTRRRWFKRFRSAPAALQISIAVVALGATWLSVNWIYQVVRKPSELFFPVSGVLYKSPTETWWTYEPIFRRHSTSTITPELLAALAQVEGSGNPIVRTYWRWSLRADPFDVYRPASSAVGMYQITNGTFAEARQYCIHDNVLVEDGAWNEWRTCWFNNLYTRTVPSHAVELTAAYLDHRVAAILARNNIRAASSAQKHALATIIHLCGAGAGNRYAARGFRLTPSQRCGDHSPQGYIARVESMRRVFVQLAQRGER